MKFTAWLVASTARGPSSGRPRSPPMSRLVASSQHHDQPPAAALLDRLFRSFANAVAVSFHPLSFRVAVKACMRSLQLRRLEVPPPPLHAVRPSAISRPGLCARVRPVIRSNLQTGVSRAADREATRPSDGEPGTAQSIHVTAEPRAGASSAHCRARSRPRLRVFANRPDTPHRFGATGRCGSPSRLAEASAGSRVEPWRRLTASPESVKRPSV